MRKIVTPLLLGLGATFLTDLWSFILRFFGVKSGGLLIVGSWLSTNILNLNLSTSQNWVLGWSAHYLIGIIFSFLFFKINSKWLNNPKLSISIYFGLVSTIFPLFIAWPIMGFGIAFSNTPIQSILIIKTFTIHLVYGVGLFLTSISIKRINKTI
ncbi:DUF2938 family protein [Flavobacterium sp. J27]|uniref:DUF2938 family protein n=1 Tax=Flavobacterium sp. J27 TaxID=2060419 RepID=UPI00102FEA1F|nr:DUF2938 family protein [Flavobacterium sp. J27]